MQLQMKVFGELLAMAVTVVVIVKCGDKNAETKMKVTGFHSHLAAQKATTFNGVRTSTTSGKLKIPMAIRLQESDMVISGCVHSHEILEKTHLLLVSQACHAKLSIGIRSGTFIKS